MKIKDPNVTLADEGLALVKKVIDLTGGEIAVESELHKGSKFTVKLRKAVDGTAQENSH